MILHNDIDMPFAKTDAEPVYLEQMKALLKRHPKTAIIWAHTGLGRIVHPVQVSAEAAERTPDAARDRRGDGHRSGASTTSTSTSRGTKSPSTPSRRPSRSSAWSTMLNKYPDRFLFGTDTVAPAGPAPYYAVFDMWAPIWQRSRRKRATRCGRGTTSGSSTKGDARVRAWETGQRAMNAHSIEKETQSCDYERQAAAPVLSRLWPWCSCSAWARRPWRRTRARRQQARGPGARPAADPRPSFEIYGFAMLDIGHDFKQINPNWFDTMRVTKLPSFEDQFGEDHNTFAGVRQSRLGVQILDADRARRSEDRRSSSNCSAPASTRARRPSACGMPTASSASSAPASTWSPFMESGRVPELARVPGDRPAWCSSATSRSAGCRSRTTYMTSTVALERPGASGDQGVYADRVELDGIKARFPMPDFSGAYKYCNGTGATSKPPACCARSSGTTRSTTRSISRATPPAGASTSARTSSRQERRRPPAVRVRRRHPELHERFAGGHRHRQQLRRIRCTPILGEPIPISALVAVPRSHLERQVQHAPSATRGRTTTTPRAGAERVQDRPLLPAT